MENPMKKFIALFALAVGLLFGGIAMAQDKPAETTPAAEASTAAAAEAAAAPAAAPTPNKGDTAWMIVATALVTLMTIPGLALFYGGMVRAKNMLAILMQVFVIFSLLGVLWTLYGYSIAFTEGNAFIGGFSKVFLPALRPTRSRLPGARALSFRSTSTSSSSSRSRRSHRRSSSERSPTA